VRWTLAQNWSSSPERQLAQVLESTSSTLAWARLARLGKNTRFVHCSRVLKSNIQLEQHTTYFHTIKSFTQSSRARNTTRTSKI